MSRPHPPPNRIEKRVKAEARAVLTCLMPHPDDDFRRQAALLMILAWFVWTFCLEAGLFTRGPTIWGGYTFHQITGFLVVWTYAKLQKLEVERFVPGLDDAGRKSSGRKYLEQDAPSDQEDGSTGGFVFRNDHSSEDDE